MEPSRQVIGSIADLGFDEQTSFYIAQEMQKRQVHLRATAIARDRAAAEEAEKQRLFWSQSNKKKALLRPVVTLDQQLYEEICTQYGYEAFGDREFLKDMQRLCPETAVAKL